MISVVVDMVPPVEDVCCVARMPRIHRNNARTEPRPSQRTSPGAISLSSELLNGTSRSPNGM